MIIPIVETKYCVESGPFYKTIPEDGVDPLFIGRMILALLSTCLHGLVIGFHATFPHRARPRHIDHA